MEPTSPGKLLKTLASQKRLTANDLFRKTKIPISTVRAYLQDERRPSEKNLSKLARVLADEANTTEDIEKQLKAVISKGSVRLTWFERLDSPQFALRILPFNYPPITDGKRYFLDELLNRLFTLSVINQKKEPELGFNLAARTTAVWSGSADMLTGLCSLPRLKLLHYYLTPIRISIGVVIHRKHRGHVKSLQQSLAGRATLPVRVITVEGEIGDVHVRQTAKITDVIHMEELDSKKLATKLKEEVENIEERGPIPLVCCDEITAMRVLEQMGEEGLLVFSPSTAESIQESDERKELPAHLAGFAVSRRETGLIQYLDAAFNLLLETEVEVTAQSWNRAYNTMFKEVTKWIANRVETTALREKERKMAETRMARGYARRAFRMTLEGIESCRQGHNAWINILRRARQLEHNDAARDRADIRNRVLDVVAGLFGMSMEVASTNINRLLTETLADSAFEQDFRFALMKEFDIELSSDIISLTSKSHLEGVVSLVQHELEIEAGRNHSIRVVPAQLTQIDNFKTLLRAFEEHVGAPRDVRLTDEQITSYITSSDVMPSHDLTRRVLIATYMRQANGFIMITPALDGKAMRLERLYVEPSARDRGIGALLVRRALEVSAEVKNCMRVLMDHRRFYTSKDVDDYNSRRLMRLLEREGFVPSRNLSSDYEYVIRESE